MSYLSVVVAGRNDGYGGDFIGRCLNFTSVIKELSLKHYLNVEILFVEWNPLSNQESISKLLPGVVVIRVPYEIHSTFSNSDVIPVFEYIAKNVGVRRANGEYILCTNPDIIMSEEMIARLAQRDLSPDYFYRADRYDLVGEVPTDRSALEKLRLCDLLIGEVQRQEPTKDFHYNASGDFLLMAKSRWFELRGYPEYTTSSHIDSYLVYIANRHGLKQVVLQEKVYHQPHGVGLSGRPKTKWDPESLPQFVNTENWGLNNYALSIEKR